jgi:hypothetical protein
MSEDSTIYWSSELKDGVTKPDILNGQIEPLEELIDTDKSTSLDDTAWHIPSFHTSPKPAKAEIVVSSASMKTWTPEPRSTI